MHFESKFPIVVTSNFSFIIQPSTLSDKCKKLQFIHKLMASDTSKSAKITKR